MTVHIRSLGGWTQRLHAFFKDSAYTDNINVTFAEAGESSSFHKAALIRRNSLSLSLYDKRQSVFDIKPKSMVGLPVKDLQIPILVDGPFGAPTDAIFKAEHAVLICTGIGVTPFVSIIQSIIQQHRAHKYNCTECRHCTATSVKTFHNLKRVRLSFSASP